MRRWVIQAIGFWIGAVSFFIAPGPFKFLGFFFSMLCFAISVRSDGEYFNVHVLLIAFFIFMLLPSNLVTFDASNSLNTNALVGYVQTGAETVTLIICIGIPLILIVGAIYAFIIGKIEESMRALLVAILGIVFTLLIAFVFEWAGVFSFGIFGFILDFYSELLSFMFELPISVYETVDQALTNTGMGISLPDIPKNKHFRSAKEPTSGGGGLFGTGSGNGGNEWYDPAGLFNGGNSGGSGDSSGSGGNEWYDPAGLFSAQDTQSSVNAKSLTYNGFIYGLHDALPLLAGLINLVSIIFFRNKKYEKILVSFFNYFKEKKSGTKTKVRKHLPKVDRLMISYAIILMFSGFFVFLAYTNSYGENAREDWRYIMFIYYAVVVGFSIFWLQKFNNYKRATPVSCFKGTLYGLAGLFLMTRLFLSRQVVTSFSTVQMQTNSWYAFNTFIFIAPAETLAFQILIPCLVLYLLRPYVQKGRMAQIEDSAGLALTIATLETDITDLQRNKDIIADEAKAWETVDGLNVGNKKIGTKKIVAERQEKIQQIDVLILQKQREKRAIEKASELPLQNDINSLLTRPVYLTVFIAVGILGSSFLFASLHYMVIMNEISFALFWMCGLAVLYFSSGCWFIIIAIKYDWLSAVLCHALYNTSTILMVLLSTA